MSRPVQRHLQTARFAAQVAGVFEQAVNLMTPAGDLVALTAPQVGDGPFNLVVEDGPSLFCGLKAGMTATLQGKQLWLGGLRIDLTRAAAWNPTPNWRYLRSRRADIGAHLPRLRAVTRHHAPNNSFLALLEAPSLGDGLAREVLLAAQRAGEALRAGWAGDQAQLWAAGVQLAGLGPGLTPAGDDFLTGAMLWAWLAHPEPAVFCHTLLQAATPRTTTLSAAFLRAAALGECGSAWHILLAALRAGDEAGISLAVQQILNHGATSGADALAGFLYRVSP